MTTLNQTQFAKHIGKSKGYVSQLKANGRLVMTDDGKLVEVEKSVQLIAETADQNRDDVAARHEAERAAKQQESPDKKTAEEFDSEKVKFSTGRAKEQHFKALKAEMDYKKEIGELVNKQDMQMAVADLVMTFRQGLENLPHLLAPTLVNKDIDYIRAALRDGVETALKELGVKCKKVIDERTAA